MVHFYLLYNLYMAMAYGHIRGSDGNVHSRERSGYYVDVSWSLRKRQIYKKTSIPKMLRLCYSTPAGGNVYKVRKIADMYPNGPKLFSAGVWRIKLRPYRLGIFSPMASLKK